MNAEQVWTSAVYGEQKYLREFVEWYSKLFKEIVTDDKHAPNDGELYMKQKLLTANMRNTLP